MLTGQPTRHVASMIDYELINSNASTFTPWVVLTAVAIAIAIVALATGLREGFTPLMALTATVAGLATLIFGGLTFSYENEQSKAEEVRAEEVVEAREVLTGAVREKYDIADMRPYGSDDETTPSETWLHVVRATDPGSTLSKEVVTVATPGGTVASYGLLFDNDTGEATLLHFGGDSPAPEDLLKVDAAAAR